MLFYTYVSGDPTDLAKTITYIKQGNRCLDCDKLYSECNCEKCPDCHFKRCMCDLDMDRFKNVYDFYGSGNGNILYGIPKDEIKQKTRKKLFKIVDELPKTYQTQFYKEIKSTKVA